MKRVFLRTLGTLALLAIVVYAGDYISLRFRIPNREQFGSVSVTPLYAIHEKNGKTEYDFAQPQSVICVHSLFPQLGYQPCWYVSRHTQKRIDI
jgi:hypothetical protein